MGPEPGRVLPWKPAREIVTDRREFTSTRDFRFDVVLTDGGLEVRRTRMPPFSIVLLHGLTAMMSVAGATDAVLRTGLSTSETRWETFFAAFVCLTFIANVGQHLLNRVDTIVVDPADPRRYTSRLRGTVPVRDLRVGQSR